MRLPRVNRVALLLLMEVTLLLPLLLLVLLLQVRLLSLLLPRSFKIIIIISSISIS